MSSYIPPHMRNRNQRRTESQKKPDANVIDTASFPSLGSSEPPKKTGAWGGASFATLAREWNEKTNEDKQQHEMEQQRERSRIQREQIEQRAHFTYRKQYEEMERLYDIPEEDQGKMSAKHDDWNVVDYKKYRPELTIEEKMQKEDLREAEDQAQREMDGSVWMNEQWDFRDRRNYTT